MANRNGTLVANTAAAVAITGERVEVLNRGGGEIWARLDGDAPTVADLDADVACIPAGTARTFQRDARAGESKAHTVRLISSGTPTYSVTVL